MEATFMRNGEFYPALFVTQIFMVAFAVAVTLVPLYVLRHAAKEIGWKATDAALVWPSLDLFGITAFTVAFSYPFIKILGHFPHNLNAYIACLISMVLGLIVCAIGLVFRQSAARQAAGSVHRFMIVVDTLTLCLGACLLFLMVMGLEGI